MTKKQDRGIKSVKISKESIEKARRIGATISLYGWTSIGSKRTDLPDIIRVVEAAIDDFYTRLEGKMPETKERMRKLIDTVKPRR